MTKAEQMYALIDARAATGKTVTDYCADVGISRSKYNYWQLRRRRQPPPATAERQGFIAVQPQRSTGLNVRLAGGLRLTFEAAQVGAAADLLLQMDRRHAEF